MSKETREHLSALVDGEISPDTSRFLVKRLGTDEELRATWTRYHLIRDCLRHQDGSIVGEDLSIRVSRALANEQPAKSFTRLSTGWLKPAAGLAIAASVALMAVVAVGPGIPEGSQPGGELAGEALLKPFVSPQGFAASPNSTQVSSSESVTDRMSPYLLRHYQVTGNAGGRGFVSFVPIVITGSKAASGQEHGEDSTKSGNSKGGESNLR